MSDLVLGFVVSIYYSELIDGFPSSVKNLAAPFNLYCKLQLQKLFHIFPHGGHVYVLAPIAITNWISDKIYQQTSPKRASYIA